MPLGSALKTKIDIDFTRAQGIASTGRILFYPPRIPVGTTMISGQPVVADLENGVASIELARLPNGATYRAYEQIDGDSFSFHFALPMTAPNVIKYEQLAEVAPVPATYTVVRKVNGQSPDPSTGNVTIEVAGTPGPKGEDGIDGTNGLDGRDGIDGLDGAPGRDGVLKAFETTGLVTGTLIAGDSGPWDLPPVQYHRDVAAAVGDRLLWTPEIFQQTDQQAAYDLVSVVAGEPARYKSTGTSSPSEFGLGGFYTAPTHGRGLRPAWWTVSAEDIVDGRVTLSFAFRNSGSGNVIGHSVVASEISVANAGPGGVL